MTHTLGDGPIQQQYQDQMRAIARGLDEAFNGDSKGVLIGRTGFVLLVFPFGNADGSRCNFISNGADRRDIVSLMREMIARFEGQPELTGRA